MDQLGGVFHIYCIADVLWLEANRDNQSISTKRVGGWAGYFLAICSRDLARAVSVCALWHYSGNEWIPVPD